MNLKIRAKKFKIDTLKCIAIQKRLRNAPRAPQFGHIYKNNITRVTYNLWGSRFQGLLEKGSKLTMD